MRVRRPPASATRSAWLAIGIGLCASIGCGSGGEGADSVAQRPNILLVTLDTTRADHIGAYGDTRAETPNIDALAAEGTLYSRAWSVASLTGPAHASILTGLYPASHGVHNNLTYVLSDELVTLAERFRGEGYTTGAFVAGLPVTRSSGMAQGFERFDDAFGYTADGNERGERAANEVNQKALPWLAEQARRPDHAPFFAWLHYYDPHHEYTPPEPFRSRFDQRPYDGEIAFVDAQLGRVLQLLRDEGVYENTLVVLTADHGEGLGEHQETFHGLLLYESVLHVPLVIRAPGRLPPGSVEGQLVSLVDIYPTLLSLAGLPLTEVVHGHDLSQREAPSSVTSDEGAASILARRGDQRVVLAATSLPWEDFGWSALIGIRRGDAKWIASPEPEFYRLDEDPGEVHDLARDLGPDDDLPALLEELLRDLTAAAPSSGTQISAEQSATLRSLGYTGRGGTHAAGSAAEGWRSGRNPRDGMDDFLEYLEARRLMAVEPHSCVRALDILRFLVRTHPGNLVFQRALADAQICLARWDDAEATLRSLLAEHPADLATVTTLAGMLDQQDRLDELIQLLLEHRRLTPDRADLDEELVRTWIRHEQLDEASAFIQQRLGEHPMDAVMRSLSAEIQLARGQEAAALQAFRAILEDAPTQRTAWRPAVQILSRSGRADEARALVQACLTRAPDDPALNDALRELTPP